MSIPEKGHMTLCPACGKTVSTRDIFTGKHTRTDCHPFQQALKDSQPGAVQQRLKSQLRQDELVKRTQTFSEKWAWVLETDFVRKHWGWMSLATNLLSWLVGYQTPNFGFFWTMITIPTFTFGIMALYFNRKVVSVVRWIIRRPVKPFKNESGKGQ